MKTICLYFQVHQPYKLKKYRFFNMGVDHYYLDDAGNKAVIQRLAKKCYLPMNAQLLRMIGENKGKFKVTFSITGLAIEQFRAYAPEVLDGFKQLAATGCVEFLAETYCHSLACLTDNAECREQVLMHSELMEAEFGCKPSVFRGTELIYSDSIGETVADMGYKGMVIEGAKHVLGWKSPNHVYANPANPRLKLLLRNYKYSNDIALRFNDRSWNEWPLTAEKYIDWIRNDDTGDVINLFMDYETFGENQPADTGIFDFMEHLPKYALKKKDVQFATPSEIIASEQPVSVLHIPYPTSWVDEERDITAWLGNELQNEAFRNLNSIRDRVKAVDDPDLNHVWQFLQCSDHFYYMSTKWFSSNDGHKYINPYASPYEAFINYMNVLNNFSREVGLRYDRLDARAPA